MVNKSLKDVIAGYLQESFYHDSAKGLYIGDITEKAYKPTHKREKYLTKRDNLVRDYLGTITLNNSSDPKSYDKLMVGANKDVFTFNFFNDRMDITLEPYQITRKPFKNLPQLITKEDWVTPAPMKMSLKGNYRPHRKTLRNAVKQFKSTNCPAPLVFQSLIDFLDNGK
jgi:hypothetical protein